MATGDRNKHGKPTDIVIHHADNHESPTLCGRKNPSCISMGIVADVTCKACLNKLNAKK